LVVSADLRLRVLDRGNGRTVNELPCGVPITSLVERGDALAVVLGGSQVRWLRIVESAGAPVSASWTPGRSFETTADGTLREGSIDTPPADLTSQRREPRDRRPAVLWIHGAWLLSAAIQSNPRGMTRCLLRGYRLDDPTARPPASTTPPDSDPMLSIRIDSTGWEWLSKPWSVTVHRTGEIEWIGGKDSRRGRVAPETALRLARHLDAAGFDTWATSPKLSARSGRPVDEYTITVKRHSGQIRAHIVREPGDEVPPLFSEFVAEIHQVVCTAVGLPPW
jgi:hypothetical protein